MKTNKVMDFARRVDEVIPDATPESVKMQGKLICSDVKQTAICAFATVVCVGRTLNDTAELGLMASKTVTKKAITGMSNFYNSGQMVAVYK